MGFPGPKCATCCTIFSLWGVVSLLLMGFLFSIKYEKLSNGAVKDQGQAATSSFITAAIYGLFVVTCGSRAIYLNLANRSKETVIFDNQ